MISGDDDDGPPEAFAQPPRVRKLRFPSQADQIAWLRQMVNLYKGNQLIRGKAIDIVFRISGCAPKAKACHALAIGRWVQENIRYVNEGIETFQSPVRTLTWRHGDCDDFTTLIASMLESIGIQSELVGLEWRGQFRHIFPRALIPVPVVGAARIDFSSTLLRLCGLERPPQPASLPLDATLRQPVGTINPVTAAVRKGRKVRTLAM